ncbi:MAG: type II secretion system protein GspE, partial [Wenzhouxiangellaceae bacterium]
RMLDMGVEDYLLTSTVNAIMAQRLVRRLDPDTRQPFRVLPEMVEELGLRELTDADPITLYRPGTSDANPNGYIGRLSIIELLIMSDEIRRLVMKQATAGELERQARAEGMRTMYQDGMLKALQGLTSPEEVLRVTQEA